MSLSYNFYEQNFRKEAANLGYSEQSINSCLNYAKPLIQRELPIIYNTTHLSALVGYKKDYLKKAAINTEYYYRKFKVKKLNGNLREISEPLPSLKEIQKWILTEILSNVKVSVFAKAYRPNTPLRENLKYHVGQPIVCTIDIKDFFPSIDLISVEKIFMELGYSKILSNLLAKLCTLNNSLPQGAPTSPYLSNLFFKPLDKIISDFCKDNKIKYTRYADDLTFSGDFDADRLKKFVSKVLSEANLVTNPKKFRVMTQNMRQTVTGIVVNEKHQVSFSKRNKLRQTMYYISTFGLENHKQHENIRHENYLQHLMGQVNFILQLNPTDREFLKYKIQLIRLLKLSSKE